MTKQKCVRTYDREGFRERSGCEDLNKWLEYGWRVVMAIQKSDYNEYIIEREVDVSRME